MYKNEKVYEEDNWPKTFMSNIDKEYMSLIFQAAYETGFDIFVKEEATDCNGRPMPYSIEVHTNERGKDHGPFWNRYNELKKEVKNESLLV